MVYKRVKGVAATHQMAAAVGHHPHPPVDPLLVEGSLAVVGQKMETAKLSLRTCQLVAVRS